MKNDNRMRHLKHQVAIIVHGGAWDTPRELEPGSGWEIPEALRQDALDGCSRAAEAGWDFLSAGGTALQAVEAAVRILEDDPTFDAGVGSVLNAAGEIELDAIIMDGATLELGAAVAVRGIRHPITLARLVMERSPHAVLTAGGAELFARAQGMDSCSTAELIVQREFKRWQDFASRQSAVGDLSHHPWTADRSCDTVGAVALDHQGHLAVATSTGGTFYKHPGRVGDSPLVGCGAYADDRKGAASATGDGEDLMRIVISKTACDFLNEGMTAQQAADAAVALLAERTKGHGGLVVLGRKGDVGLAHNSAYLAHAYVVEGRSTRGIKA